MHQNYDSCEQSVSRELIFSSDCSETEEAPQGSREVSGSRQGHRNKGRQRGSRRGAGAGRRTYSRPSIAVTEIVKDRVTEINKRRQERSKARNLASKKAKNGQNRRNEGTRVGGPERSVEGLQESWSVSRRSSVVACDSADSSVRQITKRSRKRIVVENGAKTGRGERREADAGRNSKKWKHKGKAGRSRGAHGDHFVAKVKILFGRF